MEESLLTVKEVAKQLGKDIVTVRRWIQAGKLAAVHFPCAGHRRAYRVKQSTLDKLLQKS